MGHRYLKDHMEHNNNCETRTFHEKSVELHEVIRPNILYYGTPVLLLSTLNEDGSTNISPLSSSWALGDCLVLGLGVQGQAFDNLSRHKECVINLPDATLWRQVELLGKYTGKSPVPEEKAEMGYRFCLDKFEAAGFTSQRSAEVRPDRIAECALQIEASVQHIRIPQHTPFMAIVEAKALTVHAHPGIISAPDHIDPERWNPLIYNFRHYYGLGEKQGESFRARK